MDLAVTCSPSRVRRRRAERGLTLIEVVIASAVLLVVSLGVLPLFVRSIADNAVSRESTDMTNSARSEIERYSQLDFFSPELTVVAGTSLVTDEYYSYVTKQWQPGVAPVGDPAVFTRTVTVRQFSATALDYGGLDYGVLDPAEALDATVSPDFVHLKEIVVSVVGQRQNASLSPASQITLRMVRAI